ncbi:hypothetical protein J1N35_009062 [Gossypium stocksii]|uniref:Uncharacterized protein n=1 Tax=Gossypium stocksii TaxID=47602 RepID=A0A9D3W9E3_9ROSI|nr:hypothetical protein J1N35_009062 [Gossypium stocksii]
MKVVEAIEQLKDPQFGLKRLQEMMKESISQNTKVKEAFQLLESVMKQSENSVPNQDYTDEIKGLNKKVYLTKDEPQSLIEDLAQAPSMTEAKTFGMVGKMLNEVSNSCGAKMSAILDPANPIQEHLQIVDVEVKELMRTIRGDNKYAETGLYDDKTNIIRQTIVPVQNLLVATGILINTIRGDEKFTEAPLSQKSEIIHETCMMRQDPISLVNQLRRLMMPGNPVLDDTFRTIEWFSKNDNGGIGRTIYGTQERQFNEGQPMQVDAICNPTQINQNNVEIHESEIPQAHLNPESSNNTGALGDLELDLELDWDFVLDSIDLTNWPNQGGVTEANKEDKWKDTTCRVEVLRSTRNTKNPQPPQMGIARLVMPGKMKPTCSAVQRYRVN